MGKDEEKREERRVLTVAGRVRPIDMAVLAQYIELVTGRMVRSKGDIVTTAVETLAQIAVKQFPDGLVVPLDNNHAFTILANMRIFFESWDRNQKGIKRAIDADVRSDIERKTLLEGEAIFDYLDEHQDELNEWRREQGIKSKNVIMPGPSANPDEIRERLELWKKENPHMFVDLPPDEEEEEIVEEPEFDPSELYQDDDEDED